MRAVFRCLGDIFFALGVAVTGVVGGVWRWVTRLAVSGVVGWLARWVARPGLSLLILDVALSRDLWFGAVLASVLAGGLLIYSLALESMQSRSAAESRELEAEYARRLQTANERIEAANERIDGLRVERARLALRVTILEEEAQAARR